MENKVITTIKNRVSCRSFTTKKVSINKVNAIVECGKMAPSAMNKQIANILVLRRKKFVEKLRKLSLDVYNHDCFYGANTMILVYGPEDNAFTKQDCSCILENMFIAASSLNVGSCWINQVNDLLKTPKGLKVKKALGLNDDILVVGTCILGIASPEAKLEIKPRKDNFVKIL